MRNQLLRERLYGLLKDHQQGDSKDFPYIIIDKKHWNDIEYSRPSNGEKVLVATNEDVHMAVFLNGQFFFEKTNIICQEAKKWAKRPVHPNIGMQLSSLLTHDFNLAEIKKKIGKEHDAAIINNEVREEVNDEVNDEQREREERRESNNGDGQD